MACIPTTEKRCPWHDPSREQSIEPVLSFQALGRAMTRQIIERALRSAEKAIGQ